jgi:type IV pilus assembly protein PilC
MTAPPATVSSLPLAAFSYSATTTEGEPVAGTIQAHDLQDASRRLAAMNLRVINLAPADDARRARPLGTSDFIAFNQQLAQLTKAGLPIEQGLRLIAQDLRRGRLRSAIQQIVSELERGASLPQAFERHQNNFPPLYSRLLDAGIRAGNLPAMLLNIGRHAEMVQRLRGAIWRAVSYPLTILIGLLVVLSLLHWYVMPQFVQLYSSLKPMPIWGSWWRRPPTYVATELPFVTVAVIRAGAAVPTFVAFVIAIALALIVGWPMLRGTRAGRLFIDKLILWTPLFGPPLRWNLVARWCDAVRIGAEAGVDLPQAILLADDVIASPALQQDGSHLLAALHEGRSLASAPAPRMLSPTVPAAMDLAIQKSDLPDVLTTLAELYQRQAEIRLAAVPTVLTPILMFLIAGLIGAVIAALMLPLLRLFTFLSGSSL